MCYLGLASEKKKGGQGVEEGMDKTRLIMRREWQKLGYMGCIVICSLLFDAGYFDIGYSIY